MMFKSSLETSQPNSELRTPLGNVNQNNHELSNGNSNRQLKKCGRCKQYTTHNRRTCNIDLSTLQ